MIALLTSPRSTRLVHSLTALVLLTLSTVGHAAFSVGNSVSVTYLFPNTATVFGGASAVVSGPNDSLIGFAGVLDISFTDTSISMTLTRDFNINAVDFDGLKFIDLNGTLNFDGLSIDENATNYAQFSASTLTFEPDTLFVNIVGLPGLVGQRIVLSQNPVPVPAALWLFGPVLGGLGLLRRRQAS